MPPERSHESVPTSTSPDDAPAPSASTPSSGGARRSPRTDRLLAAAALAGVFALAAFSYWWTRAPLYNPSGTLDPWFYTALFVNYDALVEQFGPTYYASRLPWIVPGRIAYGLLPVDAAYWLVHGLTFIGGVTALFFLVRRYLGLAPAFVGAATLALSAMYWNAQYWDYIDGVTMTYLLAGLCFGLPLSTGRRRAASLAIAGIFFAAAITTNVFVVVVAVVYPILYVFLQRAEGIRGRAALALRDAIPLFLGAAMLVVVLGLHSRTNGAPFFYFEPQINVIRAGTGQFKLPTYEWLRGESRILAPVFLLVAGAPVLALGRRSPAFRFAAGSYAGLAFLTAAIYGWEFLAGGNVLELTYYFSYFSISLALTMASVATLAVDLARGGRAARAGVAAATAVAGMTALAVIYREDRLDWVGRTGMKISAVAVAVAVVALIAFLVARRTRVGALAAVAATAAVAGAYHIAINNSFGTYAFNASAPDNRSLYHAALDHVDFVQRETAGDESLPKFWYQEATRPDITSVQSMYLYAYTYLDLDLPNVTSVLRERIDLMQPETIMMLCEPLDCIVGEAALRKAGYPYSRDSAERFSRGQIDFWAVLLRRAPDA